MRMNNHWNQTVYRVWAPIYDSTVNHFFKSGRKRAMALLDLKHGEKVLLVGIGTGADLPLLPAGVDATGIYLSPEMLAKARLKIDRFVVLDDSRYDTIRKMQRLIAVK